MTEILFKGLNDSEFNKYIGIGDYDLEIPLDYYLPSQDSFSMNDLIKKVISFEPSTKTIQIIAGLRYDYVSRGESFFEEVYSDEVHTFFSQNIECLNKFYEKWFLSPEYILFSKLDFLNFPDNEISEMIEDNDGFITKIITKNYGTIKFLIPIDLSCWQQLYIPFKEYNDFKDDYHKLISCFISH